MMIELHLPPAPSSNRYWRHAAIGGQARVFVSADAKAYRREVAWIARAQGVNAVVAGRLSVVGYLFPSRPKDADRRIKRMGDAWDDSVRCIDTDNAIKVLLDALTGVVWADDSQVWSIAMHRMEPVGPAGLVLQITRHVRPQPVFRRAFGEQIPTTEAMFGRAAATTTDPAPAAPTSRSQDRT